MKYDKKEIMKRAWEIKKDADRRTLNDIWITKPQVKELKPEEKALFSECLKLAWSEVKKADIFKMPQLEGTEKQVKWAEDIRRKALEYLAQMDPDNKNFNVVAATISRKQLKDIGYTEYMPDKQKRNKAEELEKLKQMYTDAMKRIMNITDARWFIRSRFVTMLDLFPDKSRDENGFLKK